MKSLGIENNLILWTLTLVLVFGLLVLLSLLKPPPSYLPARTPAATAKALASAAEAKDEAEAEFGGPKILTLTLDCLKAETKALVSAAALMRITGRLCDIPTEPAPEITNLSNGFTATVFFPEKGNFTTDFIELAEGMNRIQVMQPKGESGPAYFEISILRR